MTIQFTSIVPILRIFDVAKADEILSGLSRVQGRLGSSLRRQRAALSLGVARRPSHALERASRRRQSGRAAARDDARRRGVPSRDQRQELSLHAAWPGKDAMGHDRDGRDRPVRQSHPFLRIDRRSVTALRVGYAAGCMSAATRLARPGSRNALCGLMRCLTSMTIRCASGSSAQRRVSAAPY